MSLIKLSRPGTFLEFHDSLESSASNPGQTLLRPKYSRPGKKTFPKAEVFLVGKGLISDIPGFPTGDADHSLTFLTVHVLKGGGYLSIF
jgi:hypothetical protein